MPAGQGVDVLITEIGGTIGDIEGLPFTEAMRQFALDAGKANVLFIHVTLLPTLRAAGELKTKPTQQSVAKLREIGIQAGYSRVSQRAANYRGNSRKAQSFL